MIPGASNPLQPRTSTAGTDTRPATPERQSGDQGTHDLESDAQKFERALHEQRTGTDANEQGGKPSDDHGQPSSQEGESSPGDALLQSLFGAPPPAATREAGPLATPWSTPAPPPENKMADLAAQVAERMLVSDPASGTNTEVRIIVKDSILPETEIRIVREAGEIQVRIVTKSGEVANQLTQHQSALQALLQERLPRETVRVEVEFGGASGEESRRGTRNPRSVLEEEEEEKEPS